MPRALITGITGQDGGYLAEQLLGEGVEVHGLVHGQDAAAAQLLAAHPSVVLHEGDLVLAPYACLWLVWDAREG